MNDPKEYLLLLLLLADAKAPEKIEELKGADYNTQTGTGYPWISRGF